jgi:hypothetical protein
MSSLSPFMSHPWFVRSPTSDVSGEFRREGFPTGDDIFELHDPSTVGFQMLSCIGQLVA